MPLFLTHGEETIRTRMSRNYWGRVRTLREDARFAVHDVLLAPVPGESRHACVVLDPFAIPSHPRFVAESLPRVLEACARAERRFLMVEDTYPHSYRGGMQAVADFARTQGAEVICVYRSSMEPFRAAGVRAHHLPHHLDAAVHHVRPDLEKTHDVVLYGITDERLYPLRTRLFRVLRASSLRVLRIGHPGYRAFDPKSCGAGLAEQINRAWLGVCCPSTAGNLFAKYFEVAMNGAVVAGSMPDEDAARLWDGNYVPLALSMTDEEILAAVRAALADPERLQEMSAAMLVKLQRFTLENFADHLLEIVEAAVDAPARAQGA